ncbi:MBG domain-containing protein [Methanomassiliicoccales archaeon LGM-RCC1]|nr:MBG domain-containing protein [Methanomassiliicoccales archaeon LGM-RCC1]
MNKKGTRFMAMIAVLAMFLAGAIIVGQDEVVADGNDVVQVTTLGGTTSNYSTFGQALSEAESGSTLTLLNDIDLGSEGYVISKTLILDLNNHKITSQANSDESNHRTFKITGTADFTIKDLSESKGGSIEVKGTHDGSSITGAYGAIRFESSGTLYLNDIKLVNGPISTSDNHIWGLNVKMLNGTAYIDNVTIESTVGGCIEVSFDDEIVGATPATAYITNGKFTQSGQDTSTWISTALAVSYGATVVVDGVEYTAQASAVYVYSSGGNVILNDGTFSDSNSGAGNVIISNVDTQTYPTGAAFVTVNGGTYTGKLGVSNQEASTLKIAGGTFTDDPSSYLVEGATAKLIDGKYVVTSEAALNGIPYGSLQNAINSAQNGDTVTLLKDVEIGTSTIISINESITLDGNNHSITGYWDRGYSKPTIALNYDNSSLGYSKNNGISVVLKNLTVHNNYNSASPRPIELRGGVESLTIENCVVYYASGGEAPADIQPITIGGDDTDWDSITKLNIKNSIISTKDPHPDNWDHTDGYVITTFNPVIINIDDSKLSGWANFNIKAASSSKGSAGTEITVTGSTLYAENRYSGETNGYGLMKFEDSGISVKIIDSKIITDSTTENEQTFIDVESYVNSQAGTVRLTGLSVEVESSEIYIYTPSAELVYVNNGELSFILKEGTKTSVDSSRYLDGGYMAQYDSSTGLYTVTYSPEAKIGDVQYDTLIEAIAAAVNGDTIELQRDIKVFEQIVISSGKYITIDIGNYDIIGDYNGKLIRNEGSLTINGDNGCIYNTEISEQGHDAVVNYGTLTINGGWFGDSDNDMTNGNNVNRGAGVRNLGGIVTINGGHFTAGDNYLNSGWAYAIISGNGSENDSGVITINDDAVVYGQNNGNIAVNSGKVIVDGGSFSITGSESHYNLYTSSGANAEIEVTGGTFSKSANARASIYSEKSVVISGGTFQNAEATSGMYVKTDSGDIEISGGTFSSDPGSYVVDEFVATFSGSNYTVIPAAASLTIGSETTYYETLAEAWNAAVAQSGQATITLLSDSEGSGLAIADDNALQIDVTLDLKGHKYTITKDKVGSSGTKTQGMHLANKSTNNVVIIKNGTITSTLEGLKMIIQNYCNLTLDNVTLDASVMGYSYALSNNSGTVTVTDSVLKVAAGKTAFDVYKFKQYTSPSVTLKGSKIYGNIEIGKGSTASVVDTLCLKIDVGTVIYGSFDVDTDSMTEQSWEIGSKNTAIAAPDGFTWSADADDDGYYWINETSTGVVMIDAERYATFGLAYAAAQDDDTLTLLTDITEDIVIGKDLILDLNGYKITNVGSHTITVQNGSELTIIDTSAGSTGKVDNITHGKAAIYNMGTVVLGGGTYLRSAEAGTSSSNNGGNSFYTILNHGTMTVNSGVVVKNEGKFSSLFENGYYSYTNKDGINSPSLTINGGTFDGGLNTIKNDDDAILTINAGTFKNYTQAAFQNHSIATVNGGSFTVEGSIYAIDNCGCDATHDTGALTINGGEFTGKINNRSAYGVITINGGTFDGVFVINAGAQDPVVAGGTFTDVNVLSYLSSTASSYSVYIDTDGTAPEGVTIPAVANVVINGGKTLTVSSPIILLGKLKVSGTLDSSVAYFAADIGTGAQVILNTGAVWKNSTDVIVGTGGIFELSSGSVVLYPKDNAMVAKIIGKATLTQNYDLDTDVLELAEGAELTIKQNVIFSGTIYGPQTVGQDANTDNIMVLKNIKFGNDATIVGGSLTIDGEFTQNGDGSTITVTGTNVNISGTLDAYVTLNVVYGASVTFSDFTQEEDSTIVFDSDADEKKNVVTADNYSVGNNVTLIGLPYTLGGTTVSYVYDGEQHPAGTPAISYPGYTLVSLASDPDKTSSGSIQTDVGKYHLYYILTLRSNVSPYTESSYNIDYVWTITKADLSAATVSVGDLTYNGSELSPSVTATLASVTTGSPTAGTDFTLSYYSDVDCTVPATVQDAGTYYVLLTPVDDGNYKNTVSKGFTVDRAAVTITANDKNKAYNAADPTFDATVQVDGKTDTGLYGEDTIDYSVDRGYSGETVGNYPIIAKPNTYDSTNVDTNNNIISYNQGNYVVTYVNGTLTIGKATLSPTVQIDGWTYGNVANTPTVSGASEATSFTYTYEGTGSTSYAATTVVPTDAGTYRLTVSIASTTNYDYNNATVDFTIAQMEAALVWSNTEFTYDGNSHKPTATVSNLVGEDECDVTVTGEQTNAGASYIATATGLSNANYKLPDSVTRTFAIAKAKITSVAASQTEYTYSGSNIELPTPTVGWAGGIVNSTNYTVKYYSDSGRMAEITSAKNAGTYYVSIAFGDGANYTFSDTDTQNYASFDIKKADLSNVTITAITDQTYTGSAIQPALTVTLGSYTLVSGTDYTVSYSDNTNAGTATATITATSLNNFEGTNSMTFTIVPAKITGVTVSPTQYTYIGSGITPAPTVSWSGGTVGASNYTVKYYSNVGLTTVVESPTNVGTYYVSVVFGDGSNFALSDTAAQNYASFDIKKADLSNVTIAAITDQTYTGSAIQPALTVTLGSYTLVSGTDYTVSYSDNTNVGTATATIAADSLQNFEGTKSVNFTVAAAKITGVTVSPTQYTYTGSGITPAPTVSWSGGTVDASDYTVKYCSDAELTTEIESPTNVGTYYVTVVFNEGVNFALSSTPANNYAYSAS